MGNLVGDSINVICDRFGTAMTAAGAVQTFHGLYAQAPFFRIANHAQF